MNCQQNMIPTKKSNTRQHFHTFNALRFFSFLLVFFHHTPTPESSLLSYFSKSGGIGVSFFFVLSGFLITYILLHEKDITGKISLKKFFMRRILRIWPLFYAMILFAFLTPYILDFLQLSYSNEGYEPNWWMSLLFLENYMIMITNTLPNVSPLSVMWTLCVEEHFYIIWGLALFFLSIKKVPHLILYSIATATVFRLIYSYYGINSIDVFSNIDYFAFGAIPAYLLIYKPETLRKIEALPLSIKYFFVVCVVAIIFVFPNSDSTWLNYISHLIFGSSFTVIIVFTLCEKNSIRIKDGYWVSKLGILTYGLYLFHTIIIMLFARTIHLFPFQVNIMLFSITTFLCTVLVGYLSYQLYEKQFLKLKKHF